MSSLRFAIAAVLVTAATLPASGQRGRGGSDEPPQPPQVKINPNPQADRYKADVALEVDGMKENIQQWNDTVFSFAEPGFQEFETSKFLTGILKQNGFRIQENLAGMPTAWMATWGSGKPVIAMGSDIDDIPQ